MSKYIIVSNRLPLKIDKLNNQWNFSPTSGGLATGLKTVHENGKSLWIGWAGISAEEIQESEFNLLSNDLMAQNYKAISLSKDEIDDFYLGLSNKCIWPLFHYFKQFVEFDETQWESYVEVNQKFANAVLQEVEEGDKVWIHDYQLMLVPEMIKSKRKDVTIGFFLHIPFPSFEIFRIFPKRDDLLNGVLGADLIGFHTYDYQRHFLSSVKRHLHLSVNYNRVKKDEREIIIDTFPMGIDFEKFESTARKHKAVKQEAFSPLRKELEHHKANNEGKIILSIDRLDYTKGVINRIKSFERFLEQYPNYKEKVRLVMVSVPSRTDVSHYKKLKRETDEIIGRINGKFATVNWTPIWYYYRSFEFDDLIDFYCLSDIAMVTPLRDGMNLVAKEYLATRIDNKGVLILSELAGASKELHQSLTVNPFDINGLSEAIHEAINMPEEEQQERNMELRERIKRYNVTFWSNNFLERLTDLALSQTQPKTMRISTSVLHKMAKEYVQAKKRLFLLDYDGTLVKFHKIRNKAVPSAEVIKRINHISNQPENHLVIISGRPKFFLEKIFTNKNITFVAEHGHFVKLASTDLWIDKYPTNNDWMTHIMPVLQQFTDNTPGTLIEKKSNSLVWHYRKTDPELAISKAEELKTVLNSMMTNEISLMEGNKIIEVMPAGINKGIAAYDLYAAASYDFVFVAGDDVTDENMFEKLPKEVNSIKIGHKQTAAKYTVNDSAELINILNYICK
ncbi:MAG: bifunctional alpha,alpha-trehalose-phosphate synthase (UDP-forming)/trehalose-phosphatase [Flavobacteriaceae bacterium]